jgi:dienelactone hydrolase
MRRRAGITRAAPAALLSLAGLATAAVWPRRATTPRHPMRFFVSRPLGWSARRTHPVLVALDGAGGAAWPLALRYAAVRGAAAFLVVAPITLSSGHPDPVALGYAPAGGALDDEARLRFDTAGLLAVLDEVRRAYGGGPDVFRTGFSAGGHLLWRTVFEHAPLLRAAAPAAANYAGRGVSRSPGRATTPGLPIRAFQGTRDRLRGPLDAQWRAAARAARERGFTDLRRTLVPGAPHSPFARAVVGAFRRHGLTA